jgi:hypothetical protein
MLACCNSSGLNLYYLNYLQSQVVIISTEACVEQKPIKGPVLPIFFKFVDFRCKSVLVLHIKKCIVISLKPRFL